MGQAEARAPRRAKNVKVHSSKQSAEASFLFLYSDTGGGHRAAASAIDEALSSTSEGARIRSHHVDAFAACGVFPLREGVASYGAMLKVQPSPYPAIYHLTNGQTRYRVISELGLPFIRRNLRRMLEMTKPDVIVSVHPLINSYARTVMSALDSHATLVTVITDLVTIHHSWTSGAAADEYVVPTPEARALCIARGIAPEHVHDLGLPIRSGFHPRTADAATAKSDLGLDPKRRTLLVMAGGEGGGKLKKLLPEIADTVRALGVQLVVVAGRNSALRKRLLEITDRLGDAPQILGFIDNVADYMRAADVLLSKAGPGAIAEAFACGLPIVLFEYISGQERGNLDFVAARGGGVVALSADAVASALQRLMRPGSPELAAMRERALAAARPHAARDIARFLTGLLARRRQVSGVAPTSSP